VFLARAAVMTVHRSSSSSSSSSSSRGGASSALRQQQQQQQQPPPLREQRTLVAVKEVSQNEAFDHLLVWEALAPGNSAWPAHIAEPVAAVHFALAPAAEKKDQRERERDWVVVTRYVAGGELLKLVKRQGSWWHANEGGAPLLHARCMARQALEALRALRRAGMSHNDLHGGQMWCAAGERGWVDVQLGDLSEARSTAKGWPAETVHNPCKTLQEVEDEANHCRQPDSGHGHPDMPALVMNVLLPLFGTFRDGMNGLPWDTHLSGVTPLYGAFAREGGMRLVWQLLGGGTREKPFGADEALASLFLRDACEGEAPPLRAPLGEANFTSP
jgi:hypothetical protein